MITILLTGASGYFSWEFIHQVSEEKQMRIIAATSNPESIKLDDNYSSVEIVSNEELLVNDYLWRKLDYVVHTAFCRQDAGDRLLKSLEYSRKIFKKAVENEVKGIINLSSQSVYGTEEGNLPNENRELKPEYLYALSKAFSEVLLEEVAGKYTNITKYTNIRLASLMGPSNTVPHNVLYKFICSGLKGEEFKVIGGKQKFSFLDIRDAVNAIIILLTKISPENWKCAYNLGPEKQTNILELSNIVCEVVSKYTSKNAKYVYMPNDTKLNAGMDSQLLYETLQWKPEYSFRKTVEDTVLYIIKKGVC